MAEPGPFRTLFDELKAGRISRRTFLQRATALGVALPVVQFVANAVPAGAAQQTAATAPAAGMEGRTRGEGGELKLLQWQAATHASVHVSTGTKDSLAASLVTEPLMHYLPDSTLIPCLIKEIPSQENGLLAADLTSVTYNLLEGVLWSDGQPFTARDVAFTWQWIMNPDSQSVDITVYGAIANVEALDDLTAKVTFNEPQLAWYLPFTGSYGGGIYPEHILSAGGDANDAFRQNPIGTGPFKVESLSENDQVIYVINESYREPNKPYFARVNLKGGGDAASAARAVLQTGDFDYAWNLQVDPAILADLAEGGKGRVGAGPGVSIEAVRYNFSDPDQEVNGQRSEWQTPHPILSDKAVRQALTLACDAETITNEFYTTPTERPTPNVLTGIAAYESPNTTREFNIERANQLLDEAGWVLDGDVRKKDGVELSLTYTTTINAVRQQTQAVVKQGWEEIGVKVQLKQVDSGIFFDSAEGNDQNASHFYNDVQMYTNGPVSPFPLSYMAGWYSNGGQNMAQAENGWSKDNNQRYNSPEYDALFTALQAETDVEQAAALFVQMNDILVNDVIMAPLVNRAADKYGTSNTLRDENVAVSDFETNYWNIANWNRTE